MYQKSLSVAVLLVPAAVASAFPLPKVARPDALVTRTYDLKPVSGGRPGAPDADAVLRLILETIRIGELKPGTDGPQLVELAGGKLEVRATEKVHGEIKDLLDALVRLGDVAVDLTAELVEFDRATFEKQVKPLLKPAKGKTDPPAAVNLGGTPEVADGLVKAGKVLNTTTARYPNGAEAVVSARLSVFTFGPLAVGQGGAPQTGKEGYRLTGVPLVSGDRRFVRLKLSEQSAEVVGERQRVFNDIPGAPFVARTPDVAEYGRSAVVETEDGGAVLFRLDYAPKDRVWVVILRPTIFIQTEQDELKRPEKK